MKTWVGMVLYKKASVSYACFSSAERHYKLLDSRAPVPLPERRNIVLSPFGKLVEEHLHGLGHGLGDLTELLEEHGAPLRAAAPSKVLAMVETGRGVKRPAVTPEFWGALSKALGGLDKEDIIDLMWAYYIQEDRRVA
jgi:hypothetical protein